MNRLTPLAKFVIMLLVFSGLVVVYVRFKPQIIEIVAPEGQKPGSILTVKPNNAQEDIAKNVAQTTQTNLAPIGVTEKPSPMVIKIGVVTWGGYAAGQYWNEGFTASTESRFYRDYGFMVEFVILDDFTQSRNAWKSGEVQLLWATVDAFPSEADALREYEPIFVLQADWSRGGDVIMATHLIKTLRDLKGKKVAVALGTPSHTFLLSMLQADDMEYTDIEIVGVDSAIIAAQHFKSGKVDAAVVWSPDDTDCLKSVPGSHRLKTTREATNIIADGFFAKRNFIQANPEVIKGLYEGWMRGAAEINSSAKAKEHAIEILSQGLNIPLDSARTAIESVRLATHGDNLNFFGLNSKYTGVTGQQLYEKMSQLYAVIGLAPDSVPAWRSMFDVTAIKSARLSGAEHEAEGGFVFDAPKEEDYTSEAVTRKTLCITFPTGSAMLDENSKVLIQIVFADTVKKFAGSRIRIVGHTDDVGNDAVNQKLSVQRAKAVADYLAEQFGFDPNRFVVIGKGMTEPVASNKTKEGRAQNRRTEMQML